METTYNVVRAVTAVYSVEKNEHIISVEAKSVDNTLPCEGRKGRVSSNRLFPEINEQRIFHIPLDTNMGTRFITKEVIQNTIKKRLQGQTS